MLLGFVTACSDTGELALAEDWVLVEPGEDPTPGTPEGQSPCPRRASIIEAGAIEVDTGVCDWITLRAPSRLRLRRGRAIDLFLFHTTLAAPEPGEAVIEIRIGEQTAFERRVPIPSASGFFEETVELEETLRPGDPLWLHVHNHGANTYTLGHLRTAE